jgi:large subunit ribosomal protein L21
MGPGARPKRKCPNRHRPLPLKSKIDGKKTCFFKQTVLPLPALFRGILFYFTKIEFFNMFAIVSIAGQQFKVEEGQQIFVHRLAANEGDALTFDSVHLVDNEGQVSIGSPNVKGASVKASVIGHVKGDKVVVFKKKRRKGYRRKNGHRQQFTKIRIEGIAG